MSENKELRRPADEMAREKATLQRENLEAMPPEETLKMLHELQAHQIELETQNDELRRAQAELEAARAHYFYFYELAPVGYCTLSEAGMILEANLTTASLLGVVKGVLNHQPITRFIRKEDQDIYDLLHKHLFATGEPQSRELRMLKNDGTTFWAHLEATVARDAAGASVCRLILSDISARRFRENERELISHLIVRISAPGDFSERLSDLAASLQTWSGCEAVGIRLRDGDDYPYYETRGFPPAFVQAEKYLCAYGPDGKILRDGAGDPVLECMCGNVLCGRFNPEKPFFTTHGSFWSNGTTGLLADTSEADRQSRTRNRCNGMGYESVALIPLRAGGQAFGLLQFNDHRPDRFTHSLIAGFERLADSLAIALLQRQTDEALRKSEARNRRLQKAESLGRMAGAIAHHFNNQLQVVMGNLEMALDDQPRDSETVKVLNAALNAARKAAHVSGMMLAYRGQMPGKQEPLDLSEICRQSLPLLQAIAPKGVSLKADIPASVGPVIRANTSQIQQVLANLLTNAWESFGKDQGSITLTVKTVSWAEIPASKSFPVDWQPQDGSHACLEVANTGSGIAGKDIEKLFDPFFTTKFTGRGLGLSVVQGIIGAHGGGITVESEPGQGSVFRIFLPEAAEAAPGAKQQADKTPETEGGGTVLVIDDEMQVRTMVKKMLKRMGFTVVEAGDGIEAMEVFRQHRNEIRCVICDLTMPRMNGWETLAGLRGLSPGIPVILSSGYDAEQVMTGEHAELPQAFLGKPYRLDDLRGAISGVLARLTSS